MEDVRVLLMPYMLTVLNDSRFVKTFKAFAELATCSDNAAKGSTLVGMTIRASPILPATQQYNLQMRRISRKYIAVLRTIYIAPYRAHLSWHRYGM